MTHTSLFITGFSLLAQQAPGTAASSGNGQLLIWAIILLGMAAAFFVAEVFVPSGGLLGACAALCLIGGIVMLFGIDTTYGLVGLIISLLAIPVALMLALKVWPNTPIGRALTLGTEDQTNSPYDGQPRPLDTSHHHTPPIPVGTIGTTLTDLRPVGTCLFDGKRQECLSETGVIAKGIEVKVSAADGIQIKVRPTDAAPPD
jgi:membrane-bound ClpP family serine protease